MSLVTQPSTSNTESGQASAAEQPLRIRYRIRFAKVGLLRWISHRDLARLWERLLRRARLVLSMTEGFHPKPRVAFPSALALGVESLDEVVEIELAEDLTPRELFERLQQDDQPGLRIKSVCRLPERFGKAQLLSSDYRITLIESASRSAIQQAIDDLMSQTTVSVERKKKQLSVEVAVQITALELGENAIHLSLAASESATLRPGDVLDLLGYGDWVEKGSLITRVRVTLQRELESDDPAIMAIAEYEPDANGDKLT